MNRQILAGVFALCASAAVATAQQPPSPTPSTSPGTQPRVDAPAPQRSTAVDPEKVTFEGCIQRGMPAATATPGAVGTSGTGAFVLARASKAGSGAGQDRSTPAVAEHGGTHGPAGGAAASPGAGPAAAGTAATAGTAANAGESYRLEADEAKLAPHVGHKVEIVGTLNDHSNTDTTSGNVGRTSGNSASLKVESIKMVSASCTP